MGYIALGLLVLTLLSIGFGALLGLIRGRNRAILRLAIIILCLVLALVLRGVVVNVVMNLNIEGMTLKEALPQFLTGGDMQLPESMVNLVFALMEIIAGLVIFMVLFIGLSMVSMILFWILKIFVPKGTVIKEEVSKPEGESGVVTQEEVVETKPAKKHKPKYNKHAGLGTIIGAVQGVLVAFIICAPITGLCAQVDKISQIKVGGEPIIEIPEEIGISQLTQSGVGKIYNVTGGWFFDSLTSTKDESGNKVSLGTTVDVVTTVTGVADSFTAVTDNLDTMTSESATTEERVDAMKTVGQSFKEIGESMDAIGDDAKEMLNDVISSVVEMMAGDSSEGGESMLPPEVAEVLEDLDVNELDFSAIGGTMEGIANYIESTESENDEKELTQNDVDAIVNGFAKNTFVLDLLKSEDGDVPNIVTVAEEHQQMFKTAIEKTNLSAEYKDLLYKIFGLTK